MAKTNLIAFKPAATAVSIQLSKSRDRLLTYLPALHFHLTVANDTTSSAPKTPSGQSYEEAEFTYEPLLDDGRDGELIDILPDYLTEDIEFPRHQALKFYHKMLESMMKRIMVEEE